MEQVSWSASVLSKYSSAQRSRGASTYSSLGQSELVEEIGFEDSSRLVEEENFEEDVSPSSEAGKVGSAIFVCLECQDESPKLMAN